MVGNSIHDKDPDITESITEGKARKKRGAAISDTVIEAMLRGDSDAFRTIYLHSYERLKEFLTILLHSNEDAEEVVQDIFLYIWENREKFDNGKNFEGLLYTIAKRSAFKLIRKRRLDDKFYQYKYHSTEDFSIQPDELVMTEELSLMISLYVNNLPPQRKRVYELSRIEGKSIKEIAEIMNLSPQTVKNYLTAASNGLREMIMLFVILFLSI